ncbi:MAG: L,D-transpeptidase [Rubricoccaceae bacterium]|nr:L,D-transpeptidase [Rubricoccaceae bacterium]
MRVSRFLTPLVALLLALAVAPGAEAQDRRLYNQDELAELLYGQQDDLDRLPEVTYRYYVLDHPTGNSVFARTRLYREAGGGDVEVGKDRLDMVEFFNRVRVGDLAIGDTLVMPSHLGLDHRAYAPFPRVYPGAADLGKLFVIHKGVQAWAAYEEGRLLRWGLVNTGKESTPTPAGRFNFNWKELERISSESPPGEEWLMRYVFNFHNERGIHIHQYQMPTGEPASHGCVRLILADARWIYDWADPWVTTNGRGAKGGQIRQQGTMVLVLGEGEEPKDGPPQRFLYTPDGPRLRVVDLPADPWSVPPGSDQQRAWDRRRS